MLIDHLSKFNIYLASQSPRRKELLQGMGIHFQVMPTHVPEIYPTHLQPHEVVEYLSQLKLSTIDLQQFPDNSLFIACDTIVVLDQKIIEKPTDANDALRMLLQLSGREHTVMSGLTVISHNYKKTNHVKTKVKFRTFSEEELQYYINKYKPFDKAGSYGVQEWIGYVGIEDIQGSFYNVMGLPTHLLWQMLDEAVQSNE